MRTDAVRHAHFLARRCYEKKLEALIGRLGRWLNKPI